MIWLGIPIVIGITVAAIDYFSDDEKSEDKEKKSSSSSEHSKTSNQNSNYAYKKQQRDKFDDNLKVFKEKEEKRLSKKYLCKGCIYYSSKYRIEYRKSYLNFEGNKKLKTLERDIQYIDSLLIEINKMEKKYDKQKQSR